MGALLVAAGGFIAIRIIPLQAVHKAHQSLEASEAKYRSLYESMKEGLALHRIIRDLAENPIAFEVVDINPACETMLGMAVEAAVGKSGSEFLGGSLMDFFGDILRAADKGEPFELELPLLDNERYFNVTLIFPDREHFATLFEDVTERRKSDQQIKRLAYYDSLTGLPNRSLFLDRFDQALAGAVRNNSKVAILYIDLDGFKNINDTLGHAQGDIFLQMVAQRLTGCVRRSDTLCRLGGDEFIVLISYDGEERNVAQLAQHLLDSMSPPYPMQGREVYSTASIGISIFPDNGRDTDTLLKCADLAMYAAKESGRNGYNFYLQEMNHKAHERMEMETSLRQALERDELFLEFQPIVDVSGDCLAGAEVLVRWQHPLKGKIMPGMFIPAAEECGLSIPLGEWVLRKACEKIIEWQAAGLTINNLSVNVSGRQFEQRNFVEVVEGILSGSGVHAATLLLELTETSLMMNKDNAVATLNSLKEMGLRIVVDDFGTGYSSLSYLKNFPISRIKIDRSFVTDICHSPDSRSIVEAVIAMANSLKLNIVAEGVQTIEQRNLLLELGCREMQGFLFHRPMPEESFVELLRESRTCAVDK